MILEALPKSPELPEPKTSHLSKPIEVLKKNQTTKSADLPQKRLYRLLPKLCNTNVTCPEVPFSRPHYPQLQVPDGYSSKIENCLVDWCRQYRESNQWTEPLSFHQFPSDEIRKEQWLQVSFSFFFFCCKLMFYSFLFSNFPGSGTKCKFNA